MKTLFCAIALFCLTLCAICPARGDEAADRMLAESVAAARQARTLLADTELSWQTHGQPAKRNVGSIMLMKPNLARITLTGDYPLITLASDGKSVFTMPDATKYTTAKADRLGKNIDSPWWALPVRFFFTQSVNPFGADAGSPTSASFVGEERIGEATYRVIEIEGDKPMAYTARLYFGADKLLRRSTVTFGEGERAAVFRAEIRNVKINQRLRTAAFNFTPPATANLDTGAETRLLAVGERAPDFSLPDTEGHATALADIRQGKKATLINFWYVGCPPCRKEFPLFQKLYDELKDEGFTIVAVNKGDDATEIENYVREAKLTFPVVAGGETKIFGDYRVEAYPTSYLLDGEGKIVNRFVGVNEVELLKALRNLGLNVRRSIATSGHPLYALALAGDRSPSSWNSPEARSSTPR